MDNELTEEGEANPSTDRKYFLGWLYDWQELPLSKTHPDYVEGATVIVGRDDDGKRVMTTRVLKFTRKTVETEAGRWRLAVPK